MLLNYYELFNPKKEKEAKTHEVIKYISFTALFSIGIVMSLIRTFDPFYRFLLKKGFYEIFGIPIKEPKGGIQTEVLSTFLSSSLNIELVYIIL